MTDATPDKSNSSTGDAPAIPNLYRLLQLQPLESDQQLIESALKSAMKLARQMQDSDPTRAQQMARVIELGRKYLLSAERKSQYDARWQAQYGATASVQPELVAVGQSSAAGASEVAASCTGYASAAAADPLAHLLPSGNPHADFDLANYLESTSDAATVDCDADFQKLVNLLTQAGAGAEEQPQAVAQAVQPVSQTKLPQLPPRIPAGRGSGKSLATQLRAKRDRKFLAMISGVLVSLAALLGLLFYLVREKPDTTGQLAQNEPVPAQAGNINAIANREQAGQPPAQTPAPRSSGLPRVRGFDGMAADGDAPRVSSDMNGMTGDDDPNMGSAGEMNSAGDMNSLDDGMNNSLDMGLTMTEIPAENTAMVDDAAMNPKADGMEPAATMEPEVVLTEEEKQAWQQQMKEIRNQLSQKDFEGASQQLAATAELAKTEPQQQQLARLQSLAVLAEDFQKALVAAVTGMSAGEVITVGSTTLAFIEGTPERLIVKAEGNTERYNLIDMPAGLAHGLVDLKLDMTHPSTAARKAAFAMLHPKSNQLTLNKAKKLMQEAIDGGIVGQDMLLVFEDDYSLP